MKKSLFILLLSLFAALKTYAYDAKVGAIYYNFSGAEAQVTYKKNGTPAYTGDVLIPTTVDYDGNTYKVTSIDQIAFSNCRFLTSISIPNTITEIGYSAFFGCSSLTAVTIPNSVTKIANNAFEDCSSLISIAIPNSVTSIGACTFKGCTSLTSITIPNSVTYIGRAAFSGCSSLISVIIPNSVNEIDDYAFIGCSSLTSVTIGNSVTSIGYAAFKDCSNVKELVYAEGCKIVLPTALISIEKVIIPSTVTEIASGAFGGCSSLTSINIPNSVTEIGDQAFVDCSSLTSFTIPQAVTRIADYTFDSCSSLISIIIPNSVNSIGENAFYGCSSLTSITIPNSVNEIDNYAFCECSSLPSITIPNSVTKIGFRAFYGCLSLTSVTIPNSVTEIHNDAFTGCSNVKELIYAEGCKTALRTYLTAIEKVTIPNSVTEIGKSAFANCSSLTSVIIPNSVTSISNDAFYECSSLASVTIGNSVTSIDYTTFWGCSNVKELVFAEGCNTVFPTYLTSIKKVTIPKSVTTIMSSAFSDCSSLTTINIPESVTSIGDYAFYRCSSLPTIIIPNFVTKIGSYVFEYCSSLTTVTVGESVASIGNYAFAHCQSLTAISIPNSVTSISERAFYDCSSLMTVTLGRSVAAIDDGAFCYCPSLETIISEIKNPFPCSNSVFEVAYKKATLYVPFYSFYLYQITDGWKEFEKIIPVYTRGSITMAVCGNSNQDITEQVTVLWYDADAKQIGSGNKLNGVEEGDTLYYSIILDEDLGRKYREVIMQPIVLDSDSDSLICTLEEIPRIVLEGRVSATDIDKNPVNVTIRQMLNGKYEQVYTTQTDEQGLFDIEVFDDVTDVILSGDAYFEVPLHRDGFAGNGNLGTIPMNLVSGFAFAADITLKNATTPGAAEEVSELPGGLNNIEFSLSNVTTGEALSDFTVQNGNLIIKSAVGIGDEIRLTAKSKQNVFAEATTTFNIEEGANSISLELTELGGIDVTYASSSNGKTIGYLYDANNTLVAKSSYVGESLSLRHLPSGNYTLITMGSSALLGNLTNLSDLNVIGLNEGSDFITANIIVTDGVLSASSIRDVPRMDDSRFYYTTDNAYFSANKASVTSGDYIALSARMDLKPQYQEKVNDVLFTVDLPEGCQLVDNSVIANRQAVAYTCNGNKLMMNLDQEQWQGELRFCVIPTLNQMYTITAMASFDIDGVVSQPIGTAQFESKGLSLSTPSQTADTNIPINGTAKGKSEVSIYDNDVLIGKTTSKADGTWSASCELYKPFSHSFHDIYAKITTENGLELTSETKQVEYNKNMITPKSVTMTFYNGWYRENKTVEFNLIDGTTSPTSWPFYSAADFTFLADFTKNDSTRVKNVNIKVLNSDGTVRTLPATFDGKHGKWVATTRYSRSSRLPQNVTVEYELFSQDELDNTEFMEEQIQILSNCGQAFYNFSKEHYVLEYISDDVNTVSLNLIDAGTSLGIVTITQQDLNESIKYLDSVDFDYYIDDEGKAHCYHINISESALSINIVDLADSIAYEVSFDFSKRDISKAPINIPFDLFDVANWGNTLNGFLTTAVPYLNIKSDLDFMYDLCNSYKRILNERNNTARTYLRVRCDDGSLRLSDGAINQFLSELDIYKESDEMFVERLYEYINIYKRKIANSAIFDAAITTIGLKGPAVLAKYLKFGPNTKVIASITKQLNGVGTNTVSKSLKTYLGIQFSNALGGITNTVKRVSDFGDFHGEYEKFSSWAPMNYNIRMNKYSAMLYDIELNYKKCTKDKDKEEQNDEPLDEKSDNKPEFNGTGSKGIIDPSGYVYEAVLSNRLEGVTATCYQLTQVEDMYGDITEEAVVWNAEDYSQQNPVKTDKYGFYRWDVPQGMWQVKYEKEGYETVYSGWLPVPPPQLDVNVAMKQSTPPTVTQMRGTESGITIDMTKYMLPATMTTANITVTRNGKPEQGTIEMLNAEQAPLSSETYVQKVKFVPDSRFSVSDIVVVTVLKDVKSYCGITMTADHQETVKIESEISNIVVDAEITVPYRGERELRVLVLPREAAAGRKLLVNTSSSMIASVSANELIVEEDGSATLTLGGELPGGAVIEFAIDGSDVMTSSKIQVKDVVDMVAPPMASIPNGVVVAKGTQIELSCETEGATIYYTLDGSCPCDEAARLVYTTPIVINESVMIKAMAVAPDMEDSEIAEFSYIVTPIVGIDAATLDETIKVFPLPVRDKLNVTAGGKMIKSVTLVSTNGSVVAKAAKPETIVTLDVRSLAPSIYFVNVATEDKNYSRKIMKIE